MHYTVYRTTNLINGKFYIGTHKTKDPNDSYLGSGALLRKAIQKYGVDNFKKEVLFIFDNPEAMFAKEAEIVTAEFLAENNTYNLKLGGEGGFDWINANVDLSTRNAKIAAARSYNESGMLRSIQALVSSGPSSRRKANAARVQKYPNGTFAGRKHTSEAKAKIGAANARNVGTLNSQFGTMWITDGANNKKIPKCAGIPHGWVPGRCKSTGDAIRTVGTVRRL